MSQDVQELFEMALGAARTHNEYDLGRILSQVIAAGDDDAQAQALAEEVRSIYRFGQARQWEQAVNQIMKIMVRT